MTALSLQVSNSHLEVLYDLGSDERILALPYLNISDGMWHIVNIHRQGNHMFLFVDNGEGRLGEGRYYTESSPIIGDHQLLQLNDRNIFGGSEVIIKPYHLNPYPTQTIIQSMYPEDLVLQQEVKYGYIELFRVFQNCDEKYSKICYLYFYINAIEHLNELFQL